MNSRPLTCDDAERQRAIDALTIAVDLEQTNITFRRLGVHVASWFLDIRPNDPESLRRTGGSVSWDGGSEKNIASQITARKDIATTLALNLQARSGEMDAALIEDLAPAFRLFDPASIPDWLKGKLPKKVQENLGLRR